MIAPDACFTARETEHHATSYSRRAHFKPPLALLYREYFSQRCQHYWRNCLRVCGGWSMDDALTLTSSCREPSDPTTLEFPYVPSGLVQLGNVREGHADGFYVNHVKAAPSADARCSHPRCADGACVSDRYFLQALNEWLDEAAAPSGSVPHRSPPRATREYVPPPRPRAPLRQPTQQDIEDEMAAAFRASAAGPDGHMMIDCGANVHFFTLEDARRYFTNYRSTSMSIASAAPRPLFNRKSTLAC